MPETLRGLALTPADPALRLEASLTSALQTLGFRPSTEGARPRAVLRLPPRWGRILVRLRTAPGGWTRPCLPTGTDPRQPPPRLPVRVPPPARRADLRRAGLRGEGRWGRHPQRLSRARRARRRGLHRDAWEQNAQRLRLALEIELDDTQDWLHLDFEPRPDEAPLPPRLAGLLQEIRAATSVDLQQMMGKQFVRITHHDGARRMAAVYDAELTLLRQRAAIPSPK